MRVCYICHFNGRFPGESGLAGFIGTKDNVLCVKNTRGSRKRCH